MRRWIGKPGLPPAQRRCVGHSLGRSGRVGRRGRSEVREYVLRRKSGTLLCAAPATTTATFHGL